MHWLLASALTFAVLSCDRSPPPSPRQEPCEIVHAAEQGDVAPLVADAARTARAHGRRLVVYVGATWCEPCRYFKDAVKQGTLGDRLAGVRLLEFDFDRDEARLAAAGYTSRLIPLFAIPGPDGRASEARHEGGIKGPGAVDHLVPKLEALLRD